jgi:hypothetical protein
VKSLRQRLTLAVWDGRHAHGGVPFDQKSAWRQGYDECKRQVLRVAGREDDRLGDLQARIDRTLEYTDELLRGPLHQDVATVATAVHNSLCTPVAKATR